MLDAILHACQAVPFPLTMDATMRNKQSTQAKHKHYILDGAKIKRAQKLLGTATETETIEQALDELMAEYERRAQAEQAHPLFLKTAVQEKIEIRDVYGVLEA